MPKRVFITVAEVSGDRHAAQLIRALRELEPDVIVEGHGGPEMAAAGATIHRETVGKAAMGWRGALRAAEIYSVLRWTRAHFDAHPPDLQIGVDSPSMNFHFARAAKERNVPVLQYVAPQLWAWAEWRMTKLRRWVDRVACILPFEEAYFPPPRRRRDVRRPPAVRRAAPPPRPHAAGRAVPEFAAGHRAAAGVEKVGGGGELPGLLEAATRIKAAFPQASFLVPTTAATDPIVRAIGGGKSTRGDLPLEFKRDAFDAMVPRCDLCLTVSGTATLHVAGHNVPMVVVYHGSPVLWNLAGRWLIKIRTRTLVNLLAAGPDATPEQHVTPEFTPWNGDAGPVADLALSYLRTPEKLEAQRARLDELVRSLDHPGASMNAARIAHEMLRGKDAVSTRGALAASSGNG
jgi:lipid-A-disaccharide synthase